MRVVILALLLIGCSKSGDFDPTDPARGPGRFVGNGDPVSDGNFAGADDALPAARNVAPPSGTEEPTCDAACQSYCDGLNLKNPLNKGLCSKLWGVGLETRPVDEYETCRRLYIDMVGRAPAADEIESNCIGKNIGDTVKTLMASDDFVLLHQRHYADFFLYDTLTVNVEAIFDLDELVGKLHRGLVSYDEFAAVASAHPALTRRHATREDIAEAVFTRFIGRPPFEFEKADFGKLFTLWRPSYINHKPLQMRIPDAFIGYDCVDSEGNLDPDLVGQCTSTIYGLHTVALAPDYRVAGAYGSREMWHGILRQDEWELLQTPGRLLSQDPVFWEKAVQDVVERYMGYRLGTYSPKARQELVDYLLAYNGDIRAVHYAIATSWVYRQSSVGANTSEHVWTAGPRKQMDSEDWYRAVTASSGKDLPLCDHRISRPSEFLNTDAGRQLVSSSRWSLNENDRVIDDYSDLVKTMGGCPTNDADKRFRIVSILTTSTQLNLVNDVCDPKLESTELQTPANVLLPQGVDASAAGSADIAESVATHIARKFLGRTLTANEVTRYREMGTNCAAATCTAEEIARVTCFTTLTSAEMLFY